jgi:hypothetical protein
MRHARFASSLVVCVASLFLLASAVQAQNSLCPAPPVPDVTTWHNDNCRTGWQRNETTLTPSPTSVNYGTFGLVAEWDGVSGTQMGSALAQPLAVSGLPEVQGDYGPPCSSPCSMVLIADENNMLWAYDAAPTHLADSPTVPLWNVQLAALGGGPVNCRYYPNFAPCEAGTIDGGFVGITGTPVVYENSNTNTYTLYAVAAESVPGTESPVYYLFAVNILDGNVLNSTAITGTVAGLNPYNQAQKTGKCTTSSPQTGQALQFDGNEIQRGALLLTPGTTPPTVYVAFSPSDTEWENGWLFGYIFQNGSFSQTEVFVTTPSGTGGGIWGSGSGPASDGTYIYTATGNGTWNLGVSPEDYGDTILKLLPNPSEYTFFVSDYFTPSNVLTFQQQPPTGEVGLCLNDEDVGSGGILLFPDPFYESEYLIVSADKQSNLYFENTADLGEYNANGENNVETIATPNSANNLKDPQAYQGYWASPAYWEYLDSAQKAHYLLYYSATVQLGSKQNPNADTEVPYPIYQYALSTTSVGPGPISNGTNAEAIPTPDLFCFHSPTPTVSSNGTMAGSGILWGWEHQYQGNPTNCEGQDNGGALHAYDAAGMNELYNSASPNSGLECCLADGHFTVPTVFQGQVYVGTAARVYVFGLCASAGRCITNP